MHPAPARASRRVTVLTRSGPEHRFVTAALRDRFPEANVVVERSAGFAGSLGRRKVLSWGPVTMIDKALHAAFRTLTGDPAVRERAISGRLAPLEDEPAFLARATVVERVNHARTAEAVRAAGSELVLVYGTGPISRRTLDSFGVPVLNMHTGLSPYYRGTACHVWPLVEGRPDRLGVTVHECVPALDAGAVIAFANLPPEVVRGCPSVHAVFAELVRLGAPLYAEAARDWLDGRVQAVPQDLSLGREYRGCELGIVSEWKARRGLAKARRVPTARTT